MGKGEKLQARVKDDYRWGVITACGGAEFVKTEWRNVPLGYSESAKNHPDLELSISVPGSTEYTVDATDAAVELADERGIDLLTVVGTGTNGRILKSDVENAILSGGENE